MAWPNLAVLSGQVKGLGTPVVVPESKSKVQGLVGLLSCGYGLS